MLIPTKKVRIAKIFYVKGISQEKERTKTTHLFLHIYLFTVSYQNTCTLGFLYYMYIFLAISQHSFN
jgi:hypothetical protein